MRGGCGIFARMLCASLVILGQSAKPVNSDALQLIDLVDQHAEGLTKFTKWVMKRNGKWVKMKTQNDHLDKDQMWRANVNDVSSVTHLKGKFIYVSIMDSSPSGDWIDFTTFHFWPNGRLAAAGFRYSRIDYGGQEVTRWFDRSGKQVLREERALDGQGSVTTKPEYVKISKEFKLGERNYPMTYSGLPFAKLVPL